MSSGSYFASAVSPDYAVVWISLAQGLLLSQSLSAMQWM